MSTLVGFECARCGRAFTPNPPDPPWTVSLCCEAPLVSKYDLDLATGVLPVPGEPGETGVWRYRAVLPLPSGAEPVRLGEGGTPLLPLPRLGDTLNAPRLWLKDESANPTGSFKDRGLSVAVSLAWAAGVPGISLPTAGNAGAAAAAYAARAGLPVSIHAPESTPREILEEIRLRGVEPVLHPGSISDAGKAAAKEIRDTRFLSVATFKEPGRVEGKKTMGYELREDLGRAPEAIVYPCGGGTGIVAMAQAFDEMEDLVWIGPERPRLYAVQAAGCAPIVNAFEKGSETARDWWEPETFAAGLRVPAPFADRQILDALRRTGGGAIAVDEREIVAAGLELARTEGILACPEGAAAVAGAMRLLDEGTIGRDETTVIFQTGSGLKYLDAWRGAIADHSAASAGRAG